MNLNMVASGVAQEKRWAELAVEPPRIKKVAESIPIIPITISAELQNWVNHLAAAMKWANNFHHL